jgi:hypothetical protein
MALNSQIIQDIIFTITLVGGTLIYFKSRIPQENVKNLIILTDTYEKRIKALEDELKDNHQIQLSNVSAIADLQGQVKVYKELPLQELAEGIKQNNEISNKILDTLNKSADIAEAVAHDGGLLVKTKPNTPVTVKVENPA